MKAQYTFTVLRYVHDIVSEEFANVGVALFVPELKYLGTATTTTYGRLSKFFGEVEGEQIKKLLRHVQTGVEVLAEEVRAQLPFENYKDVTTCVARVLPIDDSSLQFSPAGGGLTDDPQATLEELYVRYVERYAVRANRSSRTDDEIWPVFRKPLAERYLLSRLRPKRIASKDYEHEFPHAWRNGLWHTCEAVSFDLVEASDLVEKANRWLGRAFNLYESEEKFKLHLLLGNPSSEKLRSAFIQAKNILNKMPGDPELFDEDNVSQFADFVESELQKHDQDGHNS